MSTLSPSVLRWANWKLDNIGNKRRKCTPKAPMGTQTPSLGHLGPCCGLSQDTPTTSTVLHGWLCQYSDHQHSPTWLTLSVPRTPAQSYMVDSVSVPQPPAQSYMVDSVSVPRPPAQSYMVDSVSVPRPPSLSRYMVVSVSVPRPPSLSRYMV